MGRVGGVLKLGGFGMVDVVVIERVWKLWDLEGGMDRFVMLISPF